MLIESNIQDIRTYKVENSCGLVEAKRAIHKQALLNAITKARQTGDIDLLMDVVEDLIQKVYF